MSPKQRLRRFVTRVQAQDGPLRTLTGNALGFLGRNSGGPEGSRVAMFHIQRCGSTVLGNMVNEDPSVLWDSEALDPRLKRIYEDPGVLQRERFDRKTFEREVRRRFVNAKGRRYCIESTHEQFDLFGIRDPLEARQVLQSTGFGVFIQLRRKNLLRQLVSTLRGIAAGNMHINAGDEKKFEMKPVDLDPAGFVVRNGQPTMSLEEQLEQRDDAQEWLGEVVGPDALQLDFETHVMKDPRIGYRLICEHIGIEARDLAPSLKRTNPQPVAQLIANPDAWRERIKGTRFEWMMDAD